LAVATVAAVSLAACSGEATDSEPESGAAGDSAVADFYEGKTVRIIMGLDAGSGADLTARLVAKYMGQYVPGEPNVIVENITGGGGLLAANRVYNTEPKDGTVIGTPLEGFPLLDVLGQEGIEFDTAKFQWLGSLLQSPSACLARADSGVDSIEDLMAGDAEFTVASTGPGGTPFVTASLLNATLGTDIEIVGGYAGSGEAALAVQNGEVDGYCVSLSTMISGLGQLLEGDDPAAKVIVVLGAETPDHPLLEGVSAAETLVDDEELLELLRTAHTPSEMSRPFALAPEVPEDRVAALREAFEKTMSDPDFLREAEAASVDIEASSGEEVTDLVRSLSSTSSETLAKLREIYGISG
jgi:tripartite-type tricarboxylate transporter receptor subunit TctC